jgi:hypothetical protein
VRFIANMDSNNFGGLAAPTYQMSVTREGVTNPAIQVLFTYAPGGRQRGGRIFLKPQVARWLGQALIAAADDQTSEAKLRLKVEGETPSP